VSGHHLLLGGWPPPAQGHAPLLRDTATLARIEAFAQRCDAR
jgi:hypothetical protein